MNSTLSRNARPFYARPRCRRSNVSSEAVALMVASNRANVVQMQLAYRSQAPAKHQPAIQSRGSEATHRWMNATTALAEDLSNQAWCQIDPNLADSFFAQACRGGSFTQEDILQIKARTVASIQAWVEAQGGRQLSDTLLGEVECLAAADEMAKMAASKLALPAGDEQMGVLMALQRHGQEYISHRTEYIKRVNLA